MLIVSGIIISLAAFVRVFIILYSKKKLTYVQTAAEMILEALRGLPFSVIGKSGEKYVPLISTLFIFILFSNWFALVPVNAVYSLFFEKWLGKIPEITAPTTDLNFTAGLALVVFFSTHFFGIMEKRGAYFSRYFKPFFFFLPINIMEELAKPFSLALRLFGNMFGKETILLILISLTVFPVIYPLPILALSLFIGLIQAYIFALLTTFYIGGAVSDGH
jgi:F-type H+-transporting ATPase subunit a